MRVPNSVRTCRTRYVRCVIVDVSDTLEFVLLAGDRAALVTLGVTLRRMRTVYTVRGDVGDDTVGGDVCAQRQR